MTTRMIRSIFQGKLFSSMKLVILLAIFNLMQPVYSVPTTVTEIKSRRIVCYYTFPDSENNLQPEKIDPNMCTHIIAGFLGINNNTMVISNNQRDVIKRLVKIKQKNNNLKILVSIGGGGGEYGFPEMAQNNSNRATFIDSVESIINELNLDGVDLDWEFPSNIFKNDKGHLSDLLEDMRSSINNSITKYLLTVAVAAPITIVQFSYDIPKINTLVDFVNIMTYDYNFFSYLTPWTGMNAPLYKRSNDFFYFATQNINYTSHYWVDRGMDKEKMNIGLPVYAHTYKLASADKTYLGAPAIGDGQIGSGGSAYYGEICDFMKEQNLVPVFDNETMSPYVTNGSEWVSFENDLSMKTKASFVYDNQFGGVMVFSLSSDDYQGKCKEGQLFPNVKIIHDIFTQ